ncbi:MAG: hypothetical protein EZS28_033430, partial [Streblomastix strix]
LESYKELRWNYSIELMEQSEVYGMVFRFWNLTTEELLQLGYTMV